MNMLVVAGAPLVLPWTHLLSVAHLILAHSILAHLILAHLMHAHLMHAHLMHTHLMHADWLLAHSMIARLIVLHLMPDADGLHVHLIFLHLLFGQLGIHLVQVSSERSPKRFLSSPWQRPAIFISQLFWTKVSPATVRRVPCQARCSRQP